MRIVGSSALLLTLLFAGAAGAGSVESLQRLSVDYAALVAAEGDFRLQRATGALSDTETADYAAFVARLYRSVVEGCVMVAQSGHVLPADLPCPSVAPAVTRSADIEQAAEKSRGEQVAALDAQLDTALGEFDEMLLREQERVKAAAPRPDDSGSGGGGARSDDEGEAGRTGTRTGDGAGGAGAFEGTEREAERSGQLPDGEGGGAGRPAGGGRPGRPPDTPDGSDDDVVARQLREAAETETDPELKQKLWEEYRKYKQGIR